MPKHGSGGHLEDWDAVENVQMILVALLGFLEFLEVLEFLEFLEVLVVLDVVDVVDCMFLGTNRIKGMQAWQGGRHLGWQAGRA